MEFTPDIKQTFKEEIATLKKMLDRLEKEVSEIENGHALEFIAPLMTVRGIKGNIGDIERDLKAWQDEGVEYTEFP
jgi:hypothetical protein